MPRLALSFLGTFEARLDGELIQEFESGKVRALLAYLAMEADRPHSRERLAGMFWGEANNETAGKNLRQALSNLRKAIRDDNAERPLLTVTPASIQAHPDSDLWLDARQFESLLAESDSHPHRNLETCAACARRMEKALSLYRGAFLEGFFLKEADAFQDWIVVRRERFHQQSVDALRALIAYRQRRGDLKPAIAHAQRLVALDPWREEAHAALMELLARDGQRSAALKQYESCRSVLMKELGVEPQEETARLVEAIRSGSLHSVQERSAPTNLPIEVTSFIGRESELEQLSDLLHRTDSRLVTLTGLGGVGKTRLALQSAREVFFAFRDGVFLVSLSSVTSPSLIPFAIAEAIGFSFAPGEDQQEQLVNFLRQKEMLLVLDNIEHLLDGMDLPSRLLQACPNLSLLITSREPLRLQAEWAITVSGLDVCVASGSDALRLFDERARHIRRDFELTVEILPQAEELCNLLNGLPLGIELAAALLRQFSIEEINVQIRRSLDFLSVSVQDIPERHRSLRAVFTQSWDSLTQEERLVLSRLSVFRGEFTREAALAVSLARPEELASLVDKSLVNFDGRNACNLHELVRQYCSEFLLRDAEFEPVTSRFIEHYSDFVFNRRASLAAREQRESIVEIESNIHHIRQAWVWAVERRMVSHLDRMFNVLHFYLDLRGWLIEGDSLFGQAALHLLEYNLNGEERITLGKLLVAQGWFNFRLGRVERAWSLLNDNIGIFRELRAGPEAAFALNYLGLVAREQGDYVHAREFHEESLQLYRASGDPHKIASALNNLGLVLLKTGELDQAARLYSESLTLRTELGDRRGISISLSNLAAVFALRDQLQEAREKYERCLDIDRGLGDQYGIADTLVNLGEVALRQGQREEAEGYLNESLAITRETGERPIITLALIVLAELHRVSERSEQALRALDEGYRLAREIQAGPLIGRALVEYAEHAMGKRDWDLAAEVSGYVSAAQDADNKNRAMKIIARLGSYLSPDELAAAHERGTRLDLEKITSSLSSA